jgi:hypothetical protein
VKSSSQHRAKLAGVDFGFSSVVLGAIGMAMFILPVLALPISGAGLVVGLIGIVVALVGGDVRLRACVAGVLLSACAAGVVWAIAAAPTGYFPPRAASNVFDLPEGRPYVPPPAPPRTARPPD